MSKKFLLIIISFILILSLCSCDQTDTNSGKVKIQIIPSTEKEIQAITPTYADLSSYSNYNSDKEYRFIDSSVQNIKAKLDNKETFIVFFGFSTCPQCNDILNILNDLLIENNRPVEYVNLRKNIMIQSNVDIENYDLVVNMFGKYLELDENNILHLYSPTVVFIKNGEIVQFVSPIEYEELSEEILNDFSNSLKLGFENME